MSAPPITAHPKIGTISFTGGTVTGRKVAETCAPMFKKVSLELGGKNPNIIFADADLDAAIAGSLRSSFANQGQICLCGSRVFVERSAYQDFVDRFVAKASQLRLGDPLEATTDQGAIVSQDAARQGEVLRRSRAAGRRQDRAGRFGAGIDQRPLPVGLLLPADGHHRFAGRLPRPTARKSSARSSRSRRSTAKKK